MMRRIVAVLGLLLLCHPAWSADTPANTTPASTTDVPPLRAEDSLTVIGAAPKTIAPTSNRVNPGIPPGVAANGQEGWVHLKLMLSSSGAVTEAKVVQSYPKGLFDQVVMDVVPGWTFKPPVNDGAYDVAVAFYMTQYRVKRGKGYGYVMDQQLVRERNDPSWRGLRAYYFQHFERLTRALDRGDVEEAGKRIKALKDDYQAGKLQITEIVRTYAMLTRYLRLTGHCDLALNEARRALLMARYMDNAQLVYGVHIEVMSCLLTLQRNDDAVDYYDS
jgi:TonB family protein